MCVAHRSTSTDRAAHGTYGTDVAGQTPTSCHEPCHAVPGNLAHVVGAMVHTDARG